MILHTIKPSTARDIIGHLRIKNQSLTKFAIPITIIFALTIVSTYIWMKKTSVVEVSVIRESTPTSYVMKQQDYLQKP